jgi:cytochrome b
MNKNMHLIWDLPTRVFHWLLTAGFIAAASLALLNDGKDALFPYHAIIGLALALMVALRIIWGLIGTRYARFASFAFAPRAVTTYLKEAFTGGGTRHLGHNPGSAYAIFAMLVLVAGITITGIMLGRGNGSIKDVHEVLAYAMMAAVGVHVLGVIFHTVRHRENIILSMFSGKKECDPTQAIASARPLTAVVFLALLTAWTFALVKNYDATARTTVLPLLNTSLQVGENEKQEKHGK